MRKPIPEVDLGGFGYQADSKSPTTGSWDDPPSVAVHPMGKGRCVLVSDWAMQFVPFFL